MPGQIAALRGALGRLILATCCAGCGPSGPETAPNVPTHVSEAVPNAVKPAVGPWFVDRARDFGIAVVTRCGRPEKSSVLDSIGTGVALFDFDGDGDLDLFVAAGTAVKDGQVVRDDGPWLFRNDGPGRWVDVTAASGLRWTGWAQGVAVADFDGDGDLDLLVCQHGQDTLWRNQGDSTFVDVTASSGIVETDWGVSATWGDADGDGRIDLYVANYLAVDPLRPAPAIDYLPGVPVFAGPYALPGQADRLWKNRGDGTFEDATEAAGLLRPDGKGMSSLFADLDDDGKLDLYVTNDTQANALFWNQGDGRFLEGGLDAGVALDPHGNAEGSMAVDVADLDGDGLPEIAISNFRREGSRVFKNLGGRSFQQISHDVMVNIHTLEFVGWGLVLGDFDGDGPPDLFQANGHVYPTVPDARYDQTATLLHNGGSTGFTPVTDAWAPALGSVRSGRAVASGDLDGDGDLDLVLTTIDGPLRVLINEGRPAHRESIVRLEGNPPNTEAIGAKVIVQAGGRSQTGWVRRGGSILAAGDSALHFGLGDATQIDRLTVRWPGGDLTTLDALPADALIIVRQRDGQARTSPFLRDVGTQRP